MSNKTEIQKVVIEYKIKQEKDFSVIVVGWNDLGLGDDFSIHGSFVEKWHWNVYANIFQSHPLFDNRDKAMDLPLHWGCTYDKIITTEPSKGVQNEYERVSKILKVGSDYAHCDDDRNLPSAFLGIPDYIKNDADRLVQALEAENE